MVRDDMQKAILKIEIDGVMVDHQVIEHMGKGLEAWKEVVRLAAIWLWEQHPECVAKFAECIKLGQQANRGEITGEEVVERTAALLREMELKGITDAELPSLEQVVAPVANRVRIDGPTQ